MAYSAGAAASRAPVSQREQAVVRADKGLVKEFALGAFKRMSPTLSASQ